MLQLITVIRGNVIGITIENEPDPDYRGNRRIARDEDPSTMVPVVTMVERAVGDCFSKVWRQSRFLNYFRNLTAQDLVDDCQQCDRIANCKGSCRSSGFATGDFLGSNPLRWK